MCTGDASADASSMSHVLSDMSCAGESFEAAGVCIRFLGFVILKKKGNLQKIRTMGVLTCVYTTEKNYVRNIRQLGVHTFVYTTKKTSYETYEKWGYSLVCILLKK